MPEAKSTDNRTAQADAGPIRFFDLETPKKMPLTSSRGPSRNTIP